MKKYIGTKTVMAEPMTKSKAEKVLNRSLADANGGEDGYFIKYPDGYKSWSPKETFEEAYKVADTYLDRMRIEYDELRDRYLRLVDFGLSEKFRTIHPEQRKMMERQSRTMLDYLHVLAERINDAKAQQLAHTQEAAAAHKKPYMIPTMNCDYEVVGFGRIEDGIYLCYEDGYKKPFPTPFGTNVETTNHGQVTHLGIKVGKHFVGLKLKSLGEHCLPCDTDLCSDDFDYKERELHALDDYEGKANTDHLKRHGEFEFDLGDDEWIPALGELAIIFKNKDKLNEALAFVGGDELEDSWHWSSTEGDAHGAWFVDLCCSTVAHGYKGGSFVVRPCCAF